MEFHWEKKNLIFDPTNRYDWMMGYSQVPTILDKQDCLRIYFTCRPLPDANGQFISHTSYIDVDRNDPSKVLYIHDEPILSLGKTGSFDEFGIHPSSVMYFDDKVYLFYGGWSRGYTVPYETWFGLAISEDGGNNFTKYSEGPIIGKSVGNPYLANGGMIFLEEGKFKMIFASALEWVLEDGKLEPVYTLKSGSSDDGINWNINNENLLPRKYENECISRPGIVLIDDTYHIWYGYRDAKDFRQGGKGSYRMGYSKSQDLKNWIRDDDRAGIELSANGWDSKMMSYPHIIRIGNRLLMFYNGNDFGKGGFGYAECIL